MEKYLLIIATLDTKGREAAYVKDCVQTLGMHPILMDVGTLEEPLTKPDITRGEVVEAAGSHLDSIKGKDRSVAVAEVQKGGAILARRLFEEGKLHGVFGMGGGTGTAIAAHIMRSLPFGLPKVVVFHSGLEGYKRVCGDQRYSHVPFRSGSVGFECIHALDSWASRLCRRRNDRKRKCDKKGKANGGRDSLRHQFSLCHPSRTPPSRKRI